MSIVIPVYRGATTLAPLLSEIEPMMHGFATPDGIDARVCEVLLVHDQGPDDSDDAIRTLSAAYPGVVRPVWLSRNYGQHAATLAGMEHATCDWIVTMDEDGQHNPADIGAMIDVAVREQSTLVYGAPTNEPPHSFLRNLTSKGSKWVIDTLSGSRNSAIFHSYRLILGDYGRRVAQYAASGVYLDVALGWVAHNVTTCPIELRQEGDRPSGYNYRTLFSHFWRMVLTSGTRLLRLVSVLGAAFAVAGLLYAAALIAMRVFGDPPAGWTSLAVLVLISTGGILFSLGVIAEYLGVTLNVAMGRPLYLTTSDLADGPLGVRRASSRTSGATSESHP
ncbi:MAG: glycosyltransferase [Micrococcales bacterium]|nr:glycosyltransferase [Micrococcales bacterium]